MSFVLPYLRLLPVLVCFLASILPARAYGQSRTSPSKVTNPEAKNQPENFLLQQPPKSFAEAAVKLQNSTCLVRVLPSAEPSAGDETRRVVLFSGVAIAGETQAKLLGGDKCAIVTPIFAAPKGRIKVTLPGGGQAQGRIRVLDEYSGLALVLLDKKLEPIEMKTDGEDFPVGSWVISAAAMGTELPLVSLGIVSGADRTIAGATYPPLLQCDLRTADTSSGAGLVDVNGKLAGIVVGQKKEENAAGGWTYAVPAKHVQRLLRAGEAAEARRRSEAEALAKVAEPETSDGADSSAQPQVQLLQEPATPDPRQRFDYGTQDLFAQEKESIVVLKCRRPIVGMVLDGGPDEVYVQRVTENGPAWRAGVRKGDQIIAADDVKIRSVYQVVRPTLYKQPGDTQRYHVEREGEVKVVEIVLDGGVELESSSRQQMWNSLTNNFVDIKDLGDNNFLSTAQNGSRNFKAGNSVQVANLGASEEEKPVEANDADKSPLELQLERYRAALQFQSTQIKLQQEQIEKLEKEREAAKELMDSLAEEVKLMKEHINMPSR
jgi:S1-C subfamily serine protease